MIHWAFEACEVRTKRDTDGQEDITMDAAEDMVSLVEHTKTVQSVQCVIYTVKPVLRGHPWDKE